MYLLPKNLLSYWFGRFMNIRLPKPIGPWSVRFFAKMYSIRIEEAEHPIEHYQCIGELFIRHLKPGMRPVDMDAAWVHPADAKLTMMGNIHNETMIQAKGKSYSVSEFLMLQSEEEKKRWEKGSYLTYYLCPTDYHRVHSPCDGKIISLRYLPGQLWPVNEWSVNTIDRLFAVNERVVIEIESERGPLALVMVGATNVGKMSFAFESRLITNDLSGDQAGIKPFEIEYEAPKEIFKGQELGCFHMGSTVILVHPKQSDIKIDRLSSKATLVGKDLYS